MPRRKTMPKRLRRDESFFGLHFDYHMHMGCTEVGRNVTRRMVRRIIDEARPDYIQIDCKGHKGIASYPTRVAYPAPGFVRDPVRIFREVTAEAGVALYMHYSGVLDAEACKRHPSWAARNADGKRHGRTTSVFGPYVDKLLIPQLKELRDEYHVDGIWLDGECWGVEPDYSRWARKAWTAETGRKKLPVPGDADYGRFLEFCREGFRRYLRHYVDAMHAHDGDYQIASNWAFSSNMPEPVCADVDFLSGDYAWLNSVNSARFEGRCLSRQGKPWDLMAWSCATILGQAHWSTKPIAQLKQEAAVVLALGGGFQAYFKQKADASINDWTVALMGELARFCRARQDACHEATPVPQIALVYPGKSFYRMTERTFAPWNGECKATTGILHALLDARLPVEIAMEHHLEGRMDDYPLIVIPEWDWLEPHFRRELLAYVRGGGNLLVIGARACRPFAKPLKVRPTGKVHNALAFLAHADFMTGLNLDVQSVRPAAGVRTFARRHVENDPRTDAEPVATITRFGKGRIAGVYADLGEVYAASRTTVVRDMLGDMARELMGEKLLVELAGSHNVDVTLMRKDGTLRVNLINTAGPHGDPTVFVFDEVPVVGPLELTVRLGRKPKAVRIVPRGGRVTWRYGKGLLRVTLPRLELHEVVVIDD
ncbi:MAG: hypothetical protein KGY99_07825 [Phycisphaerae bacterium]|nr:hypothetical protein [Phycisphaerae bacterium]